MTLTAKISIKKTSVHKVRKRAVIQTAVSLYSEQESVDDRMVGLFLNGELQGQGITDNWGNVDITVKTKKLSKRRKNEIELEPRLEGEQLQYYPCKIEIEAWELESFFKKIFIYRILIKRTALL